MMWHEALINGKWHPVKILVQGGSVGVDGAWGMEWFEMEDYFGKTFKINGSLNIREATPPKKIKCLGCGKNYPKECVFPKVKNSLCFNCILDLSYY